MILQVVPPLYLTAVTVSTPVALQYIGTGSAFPIRIACLFIVSFFEHFYGVEL